MEKYLLSQGAGAAEAQRKSQLKLRIEWKWMLTSFKSSQVELHVDPASGSFRGNSNLIRDSKLVVFEFCMLLSVSQSWLAILTDLLCTRFFAFFSGTVFVRYASSSKAGSTVQLRDDLGGLTLFTHAQSRRLGRLCKSSDHRLKLVAERPRFLDRRDHRPYWYGVIKTKQHATTFFAVLSSFFFYKSFDAAWMPWWWC